MKIPSKNFTWHFHLKIIIFRFFKISFFFEILIFLEIIFLHDEIIFFVRIFFCDQVCISSNPRNHLEHPPCPHDDSEPPTRSQMLAKIGQIHQIQLLYLCAPPGSVNCFCQNLGLPVFKWTYLGAQEELNDQTIIVSK